MTKDQLLDLFRRAGWTFVQAFLPVWAASNFSLSKVALIAAGAAGLSALKNFIKHTL